MSDSPVKKLDFESVGKENVPTATKPVDVDASVEKTVEDKVAAIKAIEANEPLLQENAHRFVLFPIKYHEVSRVWFSCFTRTVGGVWGKPSSHVTFDTSTWLIIPRSIDLAHVQEGRGLFLDRRGD